MRHFIVFKALFKRNWLTMRRYPFNFISGIVTIYLIFLIIFYGVKAVGGGSTSPTFGETLNGIVVGFTMWFLVLMAFSDLTASITQEAQQGTLEQLYMSPVGFGWVALSHLLSSLVFNLGIIVLLLFLMMASTGRWLHLDVISLLPLTLITLAGIYGVGFAMGGLALVFKRVQAALQILQFLWIALIAAPLDTFPFLKLLPLSLGANLIGQVMIKGRSLFAIVWPDLLLLVANSAFYCLIGYLIFKRLERIAKAQGLLGQY